MIHNGQGVFFWLWPLFARAPCHCFLTFFCCRPRACNVLFLVLRPVGRRNLSAGPEQNKTPPRVFVFAPGRVVLFFLLRPFPDADSVTVGRGDPSGRARMVFLFFARAPPGRLLTDCGPGPRCPGPGGVVFFVLRPRRTRRAKNKTRPVYYIGSKKTRRGRSNKKKTPLPADTQRIFD